jgi:hypothetical protein
MQPDDFVSLFILLAFAICGLRLIRGSGSSGSGFAKGTRRAIGAGAVVTSGFLLVLYGCRLGITHRSAPSVSPRQKYIAQVISREIGPGPAYTAVQVRSHWQIWPKTVLASEDLPEEIETSWPTDSELVIRYAAGYPNDPHHAARCEQHFEKVKVTCEPVAGYMLRPDPISLRGEQLRAAIDQSYGELSGTQAIAGGRVQIAAVVRRYILPGAQYLEALRTLMAAGFVVNRRSASQDVGHYSVRSGCRADVNVVLGWDGPPDSGVVRQIDGWIDVSCP